MRVWVLGLAVWLVAAGSARAQLERVPFAELPRQIQRDIVRQDTWCGIPAAISRRYESADAGPIGGPGRRDYYVGDNIGYFSPPDSVHIAYEPRCVTNDQRGTFWMQIRGAGFRRVTVLYPQLYVRGRTFLLQAPNLGCSAALIYHRARAWWDCVRFLRWSPTRKRFLPVSDDMTDKEADAWAARHGYRYRAG